LHHVCSIFSEVTDTSPTQNAAVLSVDGGMLPASTRLVQPGFWDLFLAEKPSFTAVWACVGQPDDAGFITRSYVTDSC